MRVENLKLKDENRKLREKLKRTKKAPGASNSSSSSSKGFLSAQDAMRRAPGHKLSAHTGGTGRRPPGVAGPIAGYLGGGGGGGGGGGVAGMLGGGLPGTPSEVLDLVEGLGARVDALEFVSSSGRRRDSRQAEMPRSAKQQRPAAAKARRARRALEALDSELGAPFLPPELAWLERGLDQAASGLGEEEDPELAVLRDGFHHAVAVDDGGDGGDGGDCGGGGLEASLAGLAEAH